MRYGLVLACFCMSLLAKPNLMAFPLLLLVLDAWPFNRISTLSLPGSPLTDHGSRKHGVSFLLVEKIPLLLLALAAAALAFLSESNAQAIAPGRSPPFLVLLANSAVTFIRYLYKLVYPVELACFCPQFDLPCSEFAALSSITALIVATWGTLKLTKCWPFALLGWAWFVLSLLPVSGFVQIGSHSMADRYMYFPAVGLFLIFARIFWLLPFPHGLKGLIALSLVTSLLSASAIQLQHWRDSQTLFSHDLRVGKEQNFVAYANLGVIEECAGRWQTAKPLFWNSVRIGPWDADQNVELAKCYINTGDYKKGIIDLESALQCDNCNLRARLLLASLFETLGRPDEAWENIRWTLLTLPSGQAYYKAAQFLLNDQTPRYDPFKALPFAERAVQLSGYRDLDALYLFSLACNRTGLATQKGIEAAEVGLRLAALASDTRYACAIEDALLKLYRRNATQTAN